MSGEPEPGPDDGKVDDGDLPAAAVSSDDDQPTAKPPVYEKDGTWYTTRKVNGQEEEIQFDELLKENQRGFGEERREYEEHAIDDEQEIGL